LYFQSLYNSYAALNPQAQVPTLEVRDLATGQTVVLTQSLPIIEFLDEAFPQVSKRKRGSSRCCWLIRVAGDGGSGVLVTCFCCCFAVARSGEVIDRKKE
jgi:glutathione S-transferase